MSEFKCEVVRVKLEIHPNADAIEICRVGDFQSIVKKGQFQDGDLAVYIPEQAVVPEYLLKELGFWDDLKGKGGLAGSLGNRVKAIKLRGILSQGLMIAGEKDDSNDEVEFLVLESKPDPDTSNRFPAGLKEGQDAAELLGIVKYEPTLPSHMRGRIVGVDYDATHNYDFDNLKKKPTLFDDGEEIVITEKIHGTFIQIGVVPASKGNEKYYGGRVIVSSKGMGAKGFVLDHTDETNLYAQAAIKHGLLDFALNTLGEFANEHGKPAFIMGEVFGKTNNGADVQDLTYTDGVLDFAAFDICIGNRGSEQYLPFGDFVDLCDAAEVPRVPVLYVGPYSKEVVLLHTDGNTTLTMKKQIREGVVVKSYSESRNQHYGRKVAKSVSEAYLLRKGATEFN